MTIDIRFAAPDEVDIVSAILCEAAAWLETREIPLWPQDTLSPDAIAPQVTGGLYVLAFADGEPAGVLRYQPEDPDFWPEALPGEAAYVHKVAVRRAFAGQGVAAALLAWAADCARTDSRRWLRLDTDASRHRLRAFYESQGFAYHSDHRLGAFVVARYQLPLTTVRPLRTADGEWLWTLWRRGADERPDAFGSTADEFAATPPARFAEQNLTRPDRFAVLGAFHGETLVGFVAVGRDVRERLRHVATIGPVYVVPEARGRRIGATLIEAALDHLQKNFEGTARVKLTVAVGNAPARSLYLRCGFAPYGIEPEGMRVEGRSVDMELMARAIGKPQ